MVGAMTEGAISRLSSQHHSRDPAGFDRAISNMVLEVVLSQGLSRTAIRFFVVLANKSNRRTGSCYPGINTLASELCVTPQAVRKACRQLEEAGFIQVEHNASKLRTNVFRINFRKLSKPISKSSNMEQIEEPAPPVSGPLFIGVFGETPVAGVSAEDLDLLEFASEWETSHG